MLLRGVALNAALGIGALALMAAGYRLICPAGACRARALDTAGLALLHDWRHHRLATGLSQLWHQTRQALAPALAAVALAAFALDAQADAPLRLDRQGIVVVMRHALAPGTGDPADFSLEDCGTQRNLSAAGRAQAVRIGATLRRAGLNEARVFSSPWCRCLDTAKGLGFGAVTPLPVLGSFFEEPQLGRERTRDLRAWIATAVDGPLILVTHQVNITALSGIVPASGEAVVFHRRAGAGLTLIGRLATE